MNSPRPTDLGHSGAYAIEYAERARLGPSARAKRRFAQRSLPTRALKIFHQGRRYYLLNRADAPVDRIRIQSAQRHPRLRNESGHRILALRGLPAQSYVSLGSASRQMTTEPIFRLLVADWHERPTWTGSQMLRVYSPRVVPHRLGRLGMDRVLAEKTIVDEGS